MNKDVPKTAIDLFGLGMDRVVEEWQRLKCQDPVTLKDPVVLNLGCGRKTFDWAVNLDYDSPHADVIWAGGQKLFCNDETVDHVLAFHFLEHLQPEVVIRVLRECERVLRPEGTVNIVVPYGVSDCAIQDLDHKSRFNEDTWKNLMQNPYYERGKPWRFSIGYNMIMGLSARNLVLVTQLVKQ